MSNKEKKSWVERAAELSKKIDKAGIVVGLALIAFGVVGTIPVLVNAGVILSGTSAATHVVGEEVEDTLKESERKKNFKLSISTENRLVPLWPKFNLLMY